MQRVTLKHAVSFAGKVFSLVPLLLGLLLTVCAYWRWEDCWSPPRTIWLRLNEVVDTALLWFAIIILVIGGVCCVWLALSSTSLLRFTKWLGGADLNKSQGEAADGTGAFIALATFALAEGGALTLVARGEGRTAIVLIIYVLAVFFTVVWTVYLLRLTTNDVTAGGGTVPVRAYSEQSVAYGRFALAWTTVVAFVMVFLGMNQLLPNQTYRVAYPHQNIEMEQPRSIEADGPSSLTRIVRNAVTMKSWESLLKWLQDYESTQSAAVPNHKRHLVWFEQKSEFQDAYKSFIAELTYNKDAISIAGRVVMLVRWDKTTNNLIYRQLELTPLPNGGFRDTFRIDDPNPHEVLVVLAEVIERSDSDMSSVDSSVYRLGIRVSK